MVMRFFAVSKTPAVLTGHFNQATLEKEFQNKEVKSPDATPLQRANIIISLFYVR